MKDFFHAINPSDISKVNSMRDAHDEIGVKRPALGWLQLRGGGRSGGHESEIQGKSTDSIIKSSRVASNE